MQEIKGTGSKAGPFFIGLHLDILHISALRFLCSADYKKH